MDKPTPNPTDIIEGGSFVRVRADLKDEPRAESMPASRPLQPFSPSSNIARSAGWRPSQTSTATEPTGAA